MSTPRLHTALYGRTSKDDPKRVTIEIQQQALRAWSGHERDLEVVDEYWDDGVSGKVPLWERPQGKRLLADVSSGRVVCVAVAYSDRFGRTLRDGLEAVDMFIKRGAKLIAVNDGWDSRRDDNPLYFQFRMMMAEEEHRRISKRMSDGKLRAMDRDNAPPGGPLVFGYRVGPRGEFVIDPAEAAVVSGIFERALTGQSHSAILRWAEQTGIRAGRKFQKRHHGSVAETCANNKSSSWHLSKILKILSNKVYTGTRTWAKREFPCPAIVSHDTFAAAQLCLAEKVRLYGHGKSSPERALFSGLFRCQCGAAFYHKANTTIRASGKRDRYQMYVCDSMRRGGPCRAKMLRVDALDDEVWAILDSYLDSPEELMRKVLDADGRHDDSLSNLSLQEATINQRLEALEGEVTQIWQAQRDNNWPVAMVVPRLNELSASREHAQAQLADLRKARGLLALERGQSSDVVSLMAGWRAARQKGLSREDKFAIGRAFIAGGVVETVGSGRAKKATLHLELRWGDKVASPELPKDWSLGNPGDANLTLHISLSRQELGHSS